MDKQPSPNSVASSTTTCRKRRLGRLESPNTNSKKSTEINIHHQELLGDDREIMLGTARINVKGNLDIKIMVRAICDNGSQVNLITQAAIQQLGLKPNPKVSFFQGIGGNKLGSSKGNIYLQIALNNETTLIDKFYVVKNITNYSPKESNNRWKNLKGKLADKYYNKPGQIHALLGAGIWIQIIEPGIIHSTDKLAIAHNSKLGYIILESRRTNSYPCSPLIGHLDKGESNEKLMKHIQKLWEVEEGPRITKRTNEEE